MTDRDEVEREIFAKIAVLLAELGDHMVTAGRPRHLADLLYETVSVMREGLLEAEIGDLG